jgi:hypothetical protein
MIKNLTLHRRDGRTLPAEFALDTLARLGWPIDVIISTTWSNNGQSMVLGDDNGMAVKIITGSRFLAVLGRLNMYPDDRLCIVSSDGQITYCVANEQMIQGEQVTGSFIWTEDANPRVDDEFRGIFQHPNGDLYQVHMHAPKGQIIGVQKTR